MHGQWFIYMAMWKERFQKNVVLKEGLVSHQGFHCSDIMIVTGCTRYILDSYCCMQDPVFHCMQEHQSE